MFGLGKAGLNKFGDGVAFPRLERFFALHAIDAPRLSQRSIVVTGSNGKGSTARFIEGALRGVGRRVGCFTSPHLFDVRERFLVGDAQIPRDVFDAHATTILAFNASLPEGDRMGAFEALFLIAILWFESQPLDAIVWEAGIGGRYDPVRAVRARVSAITSIELEHTELLGHTEELIAFDKSDALAPGGRLVLSPAIPSGLAARITAYAALADKQTLIAGPRARDVRNTPAGASFILGEDGDEDRVEIALIGRHQVDNAITALSVARTWLQSGGTEPAMLAGLGRARWPGRLQKVARDPDLWIDVGHTPHALDLVTEAFLEIVPREKTLVVFGVSASKDVSAIAAVAASRFDRFILTRAHKSGASPELFRDIFTSPDTFIAADTTRAARLARARAAADGLVVLAIGGLFLAVETAHAWAGGDPAALEFL